MKRIIPNRLNHLSLKSKFAVNSSVGQNYFVDLYLDDFDKRIHNNGRLCWFYILMVAYLIFIVKNFICLFCNLNNQTRLMLFDISHMIGGIPEYNEVLLNLTFTLGLFLGHKFHISRDTNIENFVLLLNLIRGKFRMVRLFLDRDNSLILDKLTRAAALTYKAATIMGTVTCKYQRCPIWDVPGGGIREGGRQRGY